VINVHPATLVSLAFLSAAAGAAAMYAYLMTPADAPPQIVEYIGQPQRILEDGAALAAPATGAPEIARLHSGVKVDVTGIVAGGEWAAITLPDKRYAYFATSKLAFGQMQADPPHETAKPNEAAKPTPVVAAIGVANAAPAPVPVLTPAPKPAPPAQIEFVPIAIVYTTGKQAPVFVEPNAGAPQRYQLAAGTSVPAILRSTDGAWILAATEDGEPAYLRTADLGDAREGLPAMVPATAMPTGPAAQPADLPEVVDGPARVLTTASLEVDGHSVTLAGITGEADAYAQQLQALIDSKGGAVHCTRHDQAYVCVLRSGIDIALSALYNGGARANADAPATYQSQAKAAQAAGRGLWQH
jgi:hypothetical protein